MFAAISRRYGRWILAFGLIASHRAAQAQGRPLSVFTGVGGAGASGSLAEGSRALWTLGVAVERRIAPRVALGAELVLNDRGAVLSDLELPASNIKLSFSTVGVAPVARYYIAPKPGSFRPVVSAGVLLWKSIGCSVDYDSDFGGGFFGGSITDSCNAFDPFLSASAPLAGLRKSSGSTLVLGLGLSNARFGFEVRAERPLGDGARASSGNFSFGNTLSIGARVHPGR